MAERWHRERPQTESGVAARLLASIVDSSLDAILSTSLDGIIRTWNAAAQRLFGYAADEVVGHPVSRLVPADRMDEERRIGERLKAGERVESFETVRVRSDGKIIPVSVAVSPIRNDTGAVIGASSIVHDETDWTERKRIEEALHRSELRYRRLFETAKDGILILAATDGHVIDVNPILCELLGSSQSDLVGKPPWQIGLFRDRSTSEAVLRELREKGECRYDRLALEDGGQHRDVEIVANLYRESTHSVIQCNVRDVSGRSRLEEQTPAAWGLA